MLIKVNRICILDGFYSKFDKKHDISCKNCTYGLVKPFKCVSCDKTFGKKRWFGQTYRNIARKKLKVTNVSLVKKASARRDIYRDIWKPFHESIKSLQCESCNKSFGDHGYLTKHVMTIHEKIKACECDSCSKRFGQKSHLERHLKNVHEYIQRKPSNGFKTGQNWDFSKSNSCIFDFLGTKIVKNCRIHASEVGQSLK